MAKSILYRCSFETRHINISLNKKKNFLYIVKSLLDIQI